jgi:hypothetical protein
MLQQYFFKWVVLHYLTPICLFTFIKVRVVLVLNYLSTMPWKRMGVWCYSSNFLEVNGQFHAPAVSPPPPGGKRPRYPLDRSLGGAHSRTLWRREKCCSAWNRNRAVQPVSRRYTDRAILTPLFAGISNEIWIQLLHYRVNNSLATWV